MGELIYFVIFIPVNLMYKFGVWKFSPESSMSRKVEVGSVDRGYVAGGNINIFQSQSPAASDQITEKESLKARGLL